MKDVCGMKMRFFLFFSLIGTIITSLGQNSTKSYDFSKHSYIDGKFKNGLAEGPWKYTFENLKCDLFFKNGLKVGTQTSYYSSGEIMAVQNYNSEGFLHGYQYILFENGDTAFKENYNNGIPHGKWSSYHKSKNLKSKAFYANGKIIHFSEYKDDSEVPFQTIDNGTGKVSIVDGDFKTVTSYYSGVKHGKSSTYLNSKLIDSTNYFKGKNIETNDSGSSVEPFTIESRELSTAWTRIAEFEKGDMGVQRHVAVNINYPIEALENDIDGIINCEFIIDTKGNISYCNPLGKKIGYGLEEESIRVVKSTSYQWTPASQDGFPIDFYMVIPVKYQIF
ncbi:MAG: energy transducer TonB [Bacteroidia bacterium]